MKILAFGVIKEIVGKQVLEISEKIDSVSELEQYLRAKYPELQKLKSFMIAVDQQYSHQDRSLEGHEEIALIPPVSGG